jgi:hypothetical protein
VGCDHLLPWRDWGAFVRDDNLERIFETGEKLKELAERFVAQSCTAPLVIGAVPVANII